MRITFGEYMPDLAPLSNPGLTRALNMRPKANGWFPARGLRTLSNATALTARPRGAISGVSAGGDGFLMCGDATKLYVQTDSATTDRSDPSGYSLGTKDRWSFTRYGSNVFAATRNHDIQFVKLGSTKNFAQANPLAPRARHIETLANRFLAAGNIYDPFEGPLPNAISWSGVGQPFNWPDQLPSPAATSIQAGRQILEGNGGAVQQIVDGADVAAVFREKSIHRMQHVGGNAIFDIDEVDQQHGMLVPYSGVAFSRQVFYIAQDGFRVFDYQRSVTIGKDKVSRTFLNDLDFDYLDRVWTAKDPDETVIWVLYPGSGHTGGRPNKLLWWDFELNRWSHGAIDAEALIQDVTDRGPSIDAPEVLPGDPDDLGDPGFENPGGTPGYGSTSFDDRVTGEGASRMGAFNSSLVASDFTGSKLEAIAETGDVELASGMRSTTNSIRPLVGEQGSSIAIQPRQNQRDRDEDLSFGPLVGQDDDGSCAIRVNSRYHRFRCVMKPGWDNAVGIDVESRVSGKH